ncbi:prepilin peptidase [Cedecea sp.]|uniref:prepilin peptidase n=1 Tax=Cedecea sp. TaxID=1970739 RepID=UPI0012AE12A0|nr:prepilin peptidase [Enterobacteriaceae bacterium RIT693]
MLVSFFILSGAILGSFCNVVIYRLPRMLYGETALSLSWPASHCPHCKKPIKVRHNIPLFGWLLLRGRCAGCGQPISLRYPLVEALLAFLYGAIVWQQGLTPQSGVDLLVVTLLVPLFFIDLQTMLLPDRLTLPLLVAALLLAASGYGAVTLPSALLAAGLGFGVPWVLSLLFHLLRGHEGMGRGDMKLLAALGAWLGPQALLDVVAASTLLALGAALVLLRVKPGEPFPFGPYPIIAALAWLLMGR